MKSSTWVRLVTFVLWAAVAASAAFWALRLLAPAVPVPPNAVPVAGDGVPRGDPTRLLGAAPVTTTPVAVAAPASSRFRLVGVVAPRASAAAPQGLAVIAVDGKPARAYRVGATVDDRLVLQRVHARGADLGPDGRGAAAAVALTLPLPTPAATGRPGLAPPPAPVAPAARPPGLPMPAMPVPAPMDEAPEGVDPTTVPGAVSLPGRRGTETE